MYRSNSARSDYNVIQLPPIALTPNPVPKLFTPEPTSLITTDQIRLPRLPHPESGLKCPRCDSTNTKFCYFNNNSVSQPRHFCRTCRRYWTRGGTLRNVPVGGGSRRNNKRQKPTSSSATSARTGKNIHFNGNIHHVGISSSLSTNLGESNVGLGFSGMQMQFQQIPFTGAFQTTDVLPIQLGASSYLGLSSKNEGLLGFYTNTNGTGMASNGGGAQASLPSFNSSSCGNAIQSYSLFN